MREIIIQRAFVLGSSSATTRMLKFTVLVLFLLLVISEFPTSIAYTTNVRETKERHAHHHQHTTPQCPADIKACIEPVTSKVCSGNGACVCGQCACFQTDFEKYYGRFCEHCDSCRPNLCELLKPCVECRIHKSGQFSQMQDCEANCSRFPEIQIAEVTSSDEKADNYFCTFTDAEDCEFYFVYGYDASGHLVIIAERDKECPVKSQTIQSGFLPGDISPSSSSSSHENNSNSITQEDYPSRRKPHQKRPVTKPPPLFTEYNYKPVKSPPQMQINDFDSSFDDSTSTYKADGEGVERDKMSISSKFTQFQRTKGNGLHSKKLNTKAFDLMIVCGLSMSNRNSEQTSQQPQYFQRNGIHFDLKNCQFIPKSESFLFLQDSNEEEESDEVSAGTSTHSDSHVHLSKLLLFFFTCLPFLHNLLY